jgi:hypothetical protein
MKPAPQADAGLSDVCERRRAYRQGLAIKGMLYRDSNAASPQRVRLRDVSMGGVSFDSQGPVEIGARCRLLIEMGPARLNWHVRIIRCVKTAEGGYLVGGQFVTNELARSGSADLDPSQSNSLHIRE